MQFLIDLTATNSKLSLKQIGGKAFNLHRLHNMRLPIPAAVVVPASVYGNRNTINFDLVTDQILKHKVIVTGEKFAVRSSGVGEDGASNSFAGVFESYLNISKEDIPNAIMRVWDSTRNSRSRMYANERGVSIDLMGVIIQRMITAEYAGVAFSFSPIENDKRIALIEVVMGTGDSLVSGKKTPATLRINKLTGMVRISRNGEDDLPEALLERIAQKVMPLVEKIEAEYKTPVDVEWAISNDKVYILQARPITA